MSFCGSPDDQHSHKKSGKNDELDSWLEDLIHNFDSNDVELVSVSLDTPDIVVEATNDVDPIVSDTGSNDIEEKEIEVEVEVSEVEVEVEVPETIPEPEVEESVSVPECNLDDGCLTSIADVRRFVLDRMIDDNEIDLELFFGDDEIITARRLAVAYYNEFPPYVDRIALSDCNQDCLPAPIMFLNGIAYQLYLAKLQKLHKEDVDYQAGGMTVNIIKKRIAYITSTIKEFKTEFENLASSRKTHINYLSAFGRVG